MKEIRDEFGKYFLKDGILFFTCHEGVKVDLEAAKKIAATLTSFHKKILHPLCVDITGVADTTKSARDFMAVEVSNFSTRCAFVSRSAWGAAIANFYLKVSKPVVPTKLFDDPERAIEFLRAAEPAEPKP